MAKKAASKTTPIDTVRHKDRRKNIPTEELRDFVVEEENAPRAVLYPRNPDLDPQLVWKGKDAQDSEPLEVPAVPVYIQEKIHPQAIVEDFRLAAAAKDKGKDDGQLSLFADFNGLPEDFDKRIDFYHYDANWQNRLILGDSLLVMTSLAEKEGLKGQVQMIYLDPPYGIKFGSNWQVSTRRRDVKDGKADDLVRQPEQIKAFRDTWELGIHSYLAYLRDRLVVARELLTESGSVFVQIGDENVHLVRCMLDEVFGVENCCGMITYAKTSGAGSFAVGTNLLPAVSDYILWYARNLDAAKYRQIYSVRRVGGAGGSKYTTVELENGIRRPCSEKDADSGDKMRLLRFDNLTSQTTRVGQTTVFPVSVDGHSVSPSKGGWKTNREGMTRLLLASRVALTGATLSYVRYFDDFPAFPLTSNWPDIGGVQSRADPKVYVVQTATTAVERCMLMTTDPGDLVLDPTCGSGTTAYVAEQWGRRWITTDTSRVALTLARTRLMAARFPYYMLADTPEGRKKEAEITGRLPTLTPSPSPTNRGGRVDDESETEHAAVGGRGEQDIRKGFVYKRVPHITLKAIANNEEIDTIHAAWQEKLEPMLEKLNKALGRTGKPKKNRSHHAPRDEKPHAEREDYEEEYKEWEVPREPEKDWPAEAKKLLKQWWEHRRERQREIDASIDRRADTELLYDQPYDDNKRVRVAGPFTVESLSPHRTISVEEKVRRAEVGHAPSGLKIKTVGPDQFGQMILENLRTAGVQNTYKKERLKFDSLEPYPGEWIHGEGRYADGDGKSRRAAVCIGPEHGTVGPQLVKEAAKEAVRGVGFDMLIVCGFAFDPHVSEESKRYGKLVVLPTRMNPDLAMGDLLKKSGAGNLFMVFGEPDVTVKRQPDGQVVVDIRGLDIYDPTTGEIRSSSTEEIACWFIDTNYNGESFFVRHAYFTGADEPYDKLKRALRAEVDEAAWSALYSTTSRPFAPPASGKLAVKVINHYGDEVLKVYAV